MDNIILVGAGLAGLVLVLFAATRRKKQEEEFKLNTRVVVLGDRSYVINLDDNKIYPVLVNNR